MEQNEHPQSQGERKATVLIIDDDLFVRTLLRNVLKQYELLEADDGLEGLRIAQKKRPDLVICDYLMPNMNGIELARLLHMDARTRSIPVILLTAVADEAVREKAQKAGVRAVIKKSTAARELPVEIDRIMGDRGP